MDPLSPSFKAVLDQVNDWVYFDVPNWNIRCWNPAARRITGWRPGHDLGLGQDLGQCCASSFLMHGKRI